MKKKLYITLLALGMGVSSIPVYATESTTLTGEELQQFQENESGENAETETEVVGEELQEIEAFPIEEVEFESEPILELADYSLEVTTMSVDAEIVTIDFETGLGEMKLRSGYRGMQGERISELPEPVREDADFYGWFNEDDVQVMSGDILTGDMTLVAVYSAQDNGQIIALSGDYEYTENLDDDGVRLERYLGTNTDAQTVVPSEIDGKAVTVLGWNAFRGRSDIVGVLNIPESIVTIKGEGTYKGDISSYYGAFSGCTGLTGDLVLPNVTKLGGYAFDGCTFEDVTMEQITDTTVYGTLSSFGGAKVTGSLNLPNVLKTGSYNFMDCGFTGDLYLPKVVSIGYHSFKDCGFTGELTISSELTTIGEDAFQGSRFTSTDNTFTFPATLTEIESGNGEAFAGFDEILFLGDAPELASDFFVTNASFYKVAGTTGWEKYPSVTEKGTANNKHTITFDLSSVSDATAVDSIKIANGIVYNIDDIKSYSKTHVFDGWYLEDTYTTKVSADTIFDSDATIYAKWTEVTENCYDGFRYTVSTLINDDQTTTKFINITSYLGEPTESIVMPSEIEGGTVISIGSLFRDWDNLKNITLPTSLKTIGSYAFYNCSSLASITLPDTLEYIGSSAFSSCSSLENIILPENLKTIGSYAFQYKNLASEITLPNSLTSVESSSFGGSIYLSHSNNFTIKYDSSYYTENDIILAAFQGVHTIVDLNEGLNSTVLQEWNGYKYRIIQDENGDDAVEIAEFVGLQADPDELEIPSEIDGLPVISIGDYAFYYGRDAQNLTGKLIIPDTITNIGLLTFANCTGLTSVELSQNLKVIGNSAFAGCSGLISVELPEGLEELGGYAFQSCSGLTSINIPSSIDTIGDRTFYSCRGLMNGFRIPANIMSVGYEAFYNTTSLEYILFEGNGDTITIDDSIYNLGIPLYHYPEATGWDTYSLIGPIDFDPDAIVTIIFDSQGGSLIANHIIVTGGTLSSLPKPTRSGYIFDGWYLEDNTEVTTNTVFDTDTTLIAKWYVYDDSGTGGDGGGSSSGGSSSGSGGSDGSDGNGDSSGGVDGSTSENTGSTGGTSSGSSGSSSSGSSSSGSSSSGSSSSESSSSSSSESATTDSTFTPTITPTTGTTTSTPTSVTNTPIVAPPTSATVENTVAEVDATTGNTVKTTSYSTGAEVVQTVTPEGSVSAEITGVTTKTAMTIPMDTTPSITEVVVIVHEDGTREIIKDTTIVSDGLRIVLDSNATIEIVDNAKTFNDVVADSWYADSVLFATSRELFLGMGEGVFAPTGTMTRAMIWQVLYNYQGSDVATSGTEWYAAAQAWAIDFGVSDGTNPNSEMTREQLVTLLYRLGSTGATSGEINSFADSGNVSDWAVDAMNWAVAEGIIAGSNGNLNPKASATRAEVAAIMMRFISE